MLERSSWRKIYIKKETNYEWWSTLRQEMKMSFSQNENFIKREI